MQRLFVKDPRGTLAEIDPGRLAETAEASEWLWLDVTDPAPEEVFDIGRRFGFDRLSLEDVLEPSQFPKADSFPGYLFLVTHSVGVSDDAIVTAEVDAFLGPHYLITFHAVPIAGIDWLAGEAAEIPAMAEGGPDRLLARLTEIVARRYLPLTMDLEARLEILEDLAISGHPDVPAAVQGLRRDTLDLRRILGPQREVMLSLARDGRDLISARAGQRFGDAYDLLFRIVEILDGERAQLGAILETHRSTIAEKMNEIMKVLTVFAAIMLPLSLMAGIYGMNFQHMPELGWRWAYYGLLGAMATVGLGLWLYFARRGFIGRPRLERIPATVVRGLGRSVLGVGNLVVAPMRLVAGALREPEDAPGNRDPGTSPPEP